MAAGGHLDDRKSLLIAFLAISDQYTTFFFFFLNGRQRPFWKFDLCVFLHCVINGYANYEVDRLIYDTVRDATSFLKFVYKMAARGHFVFPIDAKNHKVLVIWDLNGYGEYVFDWCICDKVMACTRVGVRRRRRRRRRLGIISGCSLIGPSITPG